MKKEVTLISKKGQTGLQKLVGVRGSMPGLTG